MRRQFSLLSGAILLACAGSQSATAAGPTEQRQRVQNLTPFDIGTCFPSPVDVSPTSTPSRRRIGRRDPPSTSA